MSKITRQDILTMVQEHNIHFIRLQFTDIFGMPKNVEITVGQLEKALDNEIMFDGSAIDGFVRIEESDMCLHPDYDSFVVLPWGEQQGKVARMICDVYTTQGVPFEGDPRYILRRALDRAARMGFEYNVGPECEFFLFRQDANGNPVLQTNDHAGYFDLGPTDLGEDARQHICVLLERMGFEMEASHHEGAPGQHEIGFKYADALTSADRIITFKLVVRSIAKTHGLHATFMPKPLYGHNGSGMHTNMSLMSGGKNAFFHEGDPRGLSETAYQFIAGLLEHIQGTTLVNNPLVNSYKRLVPGFEAPVYMAWSAQNRSTLIRIPTARGKGTRVELRSPDPSCNPYLSLALQLRAGLDGIERGLKPPCEVEKNIYQMTKRERHACGVHSLPSSLREAITAFEQDALARDTLGEHVYQQFLTAKKQEWDTYRKQVHDWEMQSYFSKY